jgi:uncharacterized cofD-like protein
MNKKILMVGVEKNCHDILGISFGLGVEVETAFYVEELKMKLRDNAIRTIIFHDDDYHHKASRYRPHVLKVLKKSGKRIIFVSSKQSYESLMEASDFGANDFIIRPFNVREFTSRFNAVYREKIRISCIGGGTGLFTLLLSLKDLPGTQLTSIVGMTDDGGSSGRLRTSFGILPPGDIRRSLVAMSNAPELMNEVMQYRFQKGEGIAGHSFGNLFLTALSEIRGSMANAVKGLGDILNVQGIVVPVTATKTTLCAELQNGRVVQGESKIDIAEGRDPSLRIKRIWHEPEAKANADALAAILFSDFVILGPGDLYTSVITNLLVQHVAKAIGKTSAIKIYICNLMTEPGETDGYNALGHVSEIINYLDGDSLDYVLISNTKISQEMVQIYRKLHQAPVKVNRISDLEQVTRAEVVLADIGDAHELVRHDQDKLRDKIFQMIKTFQLAYRESA